MKVLVFLKMNVDIDLQPKDSWNTASKELGLESYGSCCLYIRKRSRYIRQKPLRTGRRTGPPSARTCREERCTGYIPMWIFSSSRACSLQWIRHRECLLLTWPASTKHLFLWRWIATYKDRFRYTPLHIGEQLVFMTKCCCPYARTTLDQG